MRWKPHVRFGERAGETDHPKGRHRAPARLHLGFTAVDQVRRRIQQEQTGHRGRKDDPLFAIRRLLRRGHDHHSARSWARLLAGLDAGDTDDEQLAKTWIAAQELRLLYLCPDPASAQAHLYRWLTTAPTPGCPSSPGWPAPSTPGAPSSWYSHLVASLIPNSCVKLYPDAAHGFLFQHAEEFASDVLKFIDL